MMSSRTLLLLCGALTSVLGCDWLTHYSQLSSTALTLLQQMGDQLTEEDGPLPFPYRLYDRIKEDEVLSQLLFIRDSLQLISGLYLQHNRSAASWDADKTERFLMVMDRQTDELSVCVRTNRTADSRLQKYYSRLRNSSLSRTGGSSASWELIRSQTFRHLKQLELLVAVIRDNSRRRSAASRRRSAASRRRSAASRRRSAASRRRSAASRRRSAATGPHTH